MIARANLPILAHHRTGPLCQEQPFSNRSLRFAAMAALGVTTVVAAGCGGAQPPPVPAPASSAAMVVATGPETPDLSPAPEPEHLFALVRWLSPAKSAATVGQWIGMPLSPMGLLDLVDASQHASLVAEDEPVDVAVMLDPKGPASGRDPLVAVAMGAKSLERAKEAGKGKKGEWTQMAPGVFRLGSDDRCLLAASTSKTGARLVCGGGDRDLEELMPYMTRTLPGQSFGPADVHAEVRLLPLQRAFGQSIQQAVRLYAAMGTGKLELGEATFDRAIRRATMGLAEEVVHVVNDADLATLDLDVGAGGGELTLRTKLRGRDSWLAGTLLSVEKNQSTAPDLFWQLARDAGSAAFTRPADPSRMTEICLVLSQIIDGWLHHNGISTADRASATALFDPSRSVSAPTVWASGSTQGVGWYIAAIEEPEKTLATLRDIATVVNRPKIRSLLSKELLAPHKLEKMTLRLTPPPAGLPTGALDLEITIPLRKTEDTRAGNDTKSRAKVAKVQETTKHTAHVLAFADKGRTWIGMGSDRNVIAKTLLTAKDAKPTDEAKSRPELAKLQSEKLATGGFLTLAGLLDGGGMGGFMKELPDVKELSRLLESAPNQGKTPVTYGVGVSSQGPLTVTSSLRVPKGTIEDLIIALVGKRRR